MSSARERPRDDRGSPAPSGEGGETSDGPALPPDRIREVLRAYHRAFDGDEVEDLVPHVHRPCMVVTRLGAYVLADRSEIRSAFESVRRDLRARGCERTERRDLRVHLLDDRLARARVLTVRFDGADRELERTGATYVLRRTDGGWRIAALVQHEVVPGREAG